MKQVYIKAVKERALLNKHPWLFSGAIEKKDKSIKIGDEVRICTASGRGLATGFWCQDEGLVCRIMLFDSETVIDEKLIFNRLEKALKLRQSFGLPHAKTDGFRL